MLSLAQKITLACIFEVTAPKAGNVHRGADFDDLTLNDFLVSAVAVGPIIAEAAEQGIGSTVLRAVQETRRLTRTNANLGAVLLLAPLAAVPSGIAIGDGISRVLDALTPDDAHDVYDAIRHAQPGGLGHREDMDVSQPAPADLRAAMRAAEQTDQVAKQYCNDFHDVLAVVLPCIVDARSRSQDLAGAIVETQLHVMARRPDSLIARKCGPAIAEQSAAQAAAVLAAGPPDSDAYARALADFDFWLRSDGHRRNPGTTADLIAAALFAGLRDGALADALPDSVN